MAAQEDLIGTTTTKVYKVGPERNRVDQGRADEVDEYNLNTLYKILKVLTGNKI